MKSLSSLRLASLLFSTFLALTARAQAPPSIQFFMPDGSPPPRELRFELTSDDGRVDTFFSDSKGRFLITRSQGLRPNARYTITVRSDERTFDTTTVSFKHYHVYYVPIFLNPLPAKTNNPVSAVDVREAATPKDARAAYDRALAALKTGQAEEAIILLKQALASYPDYVRALNDLGVVYMKLDRLNEAVLMFERAIEADPRIYNPRLNLGIIRSRQARHREAVELLEDVYKRYPMLIEVRLPLADVLLAVERPEEAEGHFRAALADGRLSQEDSGDAHYKLGLLLNRKQRYREAVDELNQAVRISPKSARARLQLGGALLQEKQLADAERELIEAYRLGGVEMGAAQFLLGQVYFLERNYLGAIRAFEQYLSDVPNAPNAAEVRGVIDKLKLAAKPE